MGKVAEYFLPSEYEIHKPTIVEDGGSISREKSQSNKLVNAYETERADSLQLPLYKSALSNILGAIRFLTTGNIDELSKQDLIKLINEIDNKVDELENEI